MVVLKEKNDAFKQIIKACLMSGMVNFVLSDNVLSCASFSRAILQAKSTGIEVKRLTTSKDNCVSEGSMFISIKVEQNLLELSTVKSEQRQ